jgi:hypothetical protein
MFNDDRFHPSELYEYTIDCDDYNDKCKVDTGRGFIYKKVIINTPKGLVLKNKHVPVYTSGFTGSKIRNATTGQYMPGIVGRFDDEKQYIKIKFLKHSLFTKNNSQTLFFEDDKSYKEMFGIK